MIELSPDDDLVNAGRPLPPPVQLIPPKAAAEVSLIELTPEDDKVARPEPPDRSEPPA